jgi:hypothetical protein
MEFVPKHTTENSHKKCHTLLPSSEKYRSYTQKLSYSLEKNQDIIHTKQNKFSGIYRGGTKNNKSRSSGNATIEVNGFIVNSSALIIGYMQTVNK